LSLPKIGSETLVSPIEKNIKNLVNLILICYNIIKGIIMYINLPHLDIMGYYQFITFRTYDSVDSYIQKIHTSNHIIKHKQLLIDKYLDSSNKGCYLQDDALKYMYDFLISKDQIFYELVSFAIMPNHIHILCKPLLQLDKMIKNIKGISAKEINSILDKSGKFWANEYFDRCIRDERHFEITYRYIENNPTILSNKMQSKYRFWSTYQKNG